MDYWELKIAQMYQTLLKSSKLGLLLLLAISCNKNNTTLPYYNTADFTPIFSESIDEVEKLVPHKIGDFKLTNQNNEEVSHKNIEGKVHIASFIFTSCGSICPTMTRNLKRVEEEYGTNPDVKILSYSVTPWKDSVPVLKAYEKEFDIQTKNWHFLTGSKKDIYNLARTSYFAEENIGLQKDSNDFLHTEHIILVDREKRIRGIYNGTLELEIMQLSKDIESLLESK